MINFSDQFAALIYRSHITFSIFLLLFEEVVCTCGVVDGVESKFSVLNIVVRERSCVVLAESSISTKINAINYEKHFPKIYLEYTSMIAP